MTRAAAEAHLAYANSANGYSDAVIAGRVQALEAALNSLPKGWWRDAPLAEVTHLRATGPGLTEERTDVA